MTNEPDQPISADEAEAIRREQVVDTYAALLDKIWQRSVTILGLVTIRAIMQRAIWLTMHQYPLIGMLTVGERGVSSTELRNRVGQHDRTSIREGFEELILNLFDLLAKLTGESIVKRLFRTELADRPLPPAGDAPGPASPAPDPEP